MELQEDSDRSSSLLSSKRNYENESVKKSSVNNGLENSKIGFLVV